MQLDTEIIVALITSSVALGLGILSTIRSNRTNEITQNHEQQLLNLQAEKQRTQFMAEFLVKELLQHPDFELRSFGQIKKRLKGFEDDELRRILIKAGALHFESKDGKKEMWGLLSRNYELLKLKPNEEL